MFTILNNRRSTAFVLFSAALLVRLFYYYFHTDMTFGMVSVLGIPFSDAANWNDLALDISQGFGMRGPWTADRPFYPLLLACFYTWTGESFFVAKMINVILSSLAVPFAYLIGEKVFTRSVGLITACYLVFNHHHLNYMLTLMSETTGFTFLVMSIYFLITGLEQKGKMYLVSSGVLFGVSNLARTMTLLAFPGYIVCMVHILKREKIPYKRIASYIAIFALGAFIVIAPWLIRQKVVHGIVSISHKTAVVLYSATSPKHGFWDGSVGRETEIDKTHVKSIAELNRYYMEKVKENLIKYPQFFINNFFSSFYKYWMFLSDKVDILQLGRIPYLYHVRISLLIVLAGMGLSVIAVKNRYPLILANTLVFTGVAVGMVGGGHFLDRPSLMIDWLFLYFYIFFFVRILQYFYYKKTGHAFSFAEGRSYSPNWLNKIYRTAFVIAVIFLSISGVKLLYLYYVTHPDAPVFRQIPVKGKQDILAEVKNRLPEAYDEGEFSIEDAFVEPVDFTRDMINHRRLVVRSGRVSRYAYNIKKDISIQHWSRLFFSARPYDRTVLYVHNVGFVVFPEKIPEGFIGRDVIIAGRLNVDEHQVFQGRVIVEGIAMIPVDGKSGDLDMDRILLADNDMHKKSLLMGQVKKHGL